MFRFACRNLRIREDTAKYLRNLDTNSAHYDPKTRSMREDPRPDVDPNEKFYGVSVAFEILSIGCSFVFISHILLVFSCSILLTTFEITG